MMNNIEKAKLKEIYDRLDNCLKTRDTDISANGCTAENRFISDEIIDLRKLGIEITLPSIYAAPIDSYGYSYFELVSEILRQIKPYFNPTKTWIKNNIIPLLMLFNAILSTIAAVMSIIK